MILVTGASGFIGTELCESLRYSGYLVRSVVRNIYKAELNCDTEHAANFRVNHDVISVGEISSETDWHTALCGVSHVVHLAARVHIMNEVSPDRIMEFRRVNVDATANLAKQAALAGVRRFIYLSSIKVNGEFTKAGYPFTADDVPDPLDPYSVSKYEAEILLRQIARETSMEVVILRPPLVYGPRVGANFESMMRWLKRGIPMPLGAIRQNQRSMVALGNLVDLIMVCLNHPAAANQIFLASDGDDLSTVALLQRMANALGVKARLFNVSPILLKFGAKLLGKESVYLRLCESLQIDMTKTRQLLNWNPPLSVDIGLQLAAKGNI